MALIVADRPCAAAGVFTRSRTPAATISVNRRHLRSGYAAAIVCNSGNANASTGRQGHRDAVATCRLVAERLRARPGFDPGTRDVLVASTGPIGHLLPMDRIDRGITTLVRQLGRGRTADQEAARAIMTTDLVPKTAYRQWTIGGGRIQMGGIAKGSGMIGPNLATMLAFVTTDASIEPPLLQAVLRDAAASSFNRISVDQHTSPSDTVLVLASGAATGPPIRRTGSALNRFTSALNSLCQDLAYQIVADGEGATKIFRVRVTEAHSEREADRVARAVVNSPMVKTAVHGSDPNWGRIITAAGYSGVALEPARSSLWIGRCGGGAGRKGAGGTGGTGDRSWGGTAGKAGGAICLYDHGEPVALNARQTRRLATIMDSKDPTFTLTLGRGQAAVEWLGCDLSRQYVAINADYTT